MFSIFPNAVINDNQNPRTPPGRCVGDIDIETLNRTSEMLRFLFLNKMSKSQKKN